MSMKNLSPFVNFALFLVCTGAISHTTYNHIFLDSDKELLQQWREFRYEKEGRHSESGPRGTSLNPSKVNSNCNDPSKSKTQSSTPTYPSKQQPPRRAEWSYRLHSSHHLQTPILEPEPTKPTPNHQILKPPRRPEALYVGTPTAPGKEHPTVVSM